MNDKADPEVVRWACITLHPSLPSRFTQIAGARAWGAHPDWREGADMSRVFIDDVSTTGRTTRWEGKLPMRDALIDALSGKPGPHNRVFFRSPLCIGFSDRQAAETMARIFSQGAMVYVQSEAGLYRDGDDLTEIMEAVRRDAKAAAQRRWRANKNEAGET